MTSNTARATGTTHGDKSAASAEASLPLSDQALLHWVSVGAVGSAVFLTDASGNFVCLGSDTERTLGYSEADFRTMGNIYAFLGEDMPGAAEIADAEQIVGLERTVTIKSGESRRLLIDISSVDLAEGRLLFVCRDITDRWRAENELVRHRRTLQTILDGLPDIVALQKPDHTIIAYNETGYRLLGVTPEQVAGRKCFELIGRQKPCRRCATERARRSRHTESIEKYLPEMDAWIRARSIPIVGLDGEVSMIVEQITDISDQKKVEESLRRSEELLSETGDLAGVGGWEVDLETNRVSWTRTTARLHETEEGFEPTLEEAVAFFAPEDQPRVRAAVQRAGEEARPFDEEYRLITARGRERRVRAIGRPHLEDGKCVRLQGAVQDITEQKRDARRLEEATAIINRSPAVAFTWRNESGWPVEYVSENVAGIFGYSAEDFVAGRVAYAALIHPDDRARVGREVAEFCSDIEASEFVHEPYRIVARDGSCRIVSDWTFAERDRDGNATRLKGMVQDITEKVRIEQALRESEEKFRAVLDNVGIGIALISPDMEVLSLNRQMREWFPDVVLEDRPLCYRSFNIPPSDGVCSYCPTVRTLRDGQVHESLTRTPSGDSIRNFRIVSSAITDPEGKVVAAIEMVEDITDRMKMEGELLKVHKLESIGTLAGGIAHDFNNLLGAILGNVSLAGTYLQPEHPAEGLLTEVEKACERAKGLTHQLLTFAKGGAPVKRPVSVSDLVVESADFVLHGSGVRALYELAQNLPKVAADETQLSQVIANLVINAKEAMPEGGKVRIAVHLKQITEETRLPLDPGKYAEISVADGGAGIAERDLNRVFDPFFTTKKTGSGLGLAVVYSVVRSHGGHVEVSSEIGRGTTFTVYLPALPSTREGSTASPSPATESSVRILVMDDEELIRDMARAILTTHGHEVEVAEDGARAVEIFARTQQQGVPPDLVILDLTVPGGMGGVETLRRLRELDPGLPAVVSSGYADNPVVADYRSHGFASCLPKPYAPGDLIRTVSKLLGKE